MARNREAYHEYFVEEEIEAGIELVGTEVKSIRAGTLNLKDAWCGIKDGDMLLNQMHISPYDHGNRFNVDSRRPRRLRSPLLFARPRLRRDLASPFRAAASPPPSTFGGRRCRRGRRAAPAGCRRGS